MPDQTVHQASDFKVDTLPDAKPVLTHVTVTKMHTYTIVHNVHRYMHELSNTTDICSSCDRVKNSLVAEQTESRWLTDSSSPLVGR